MTVDVLRAAIARHRSGDLAGAEQLYRQVLEAEPGRADTLHLLGLLLGAVGRSDEAASYLSEAARRVPAQALYQLAAGEALRAAGKSAEAGALLEKARQRFPADAALATALGLALFDQANVAMAAGRLPMAEALLRRAIDLMPLSAEAHFNLGNALSEQGRLEAALGAYGAALERAPLLGPAHTNLMRALKRLGRTGEAALHGRRAIAIEPSSYPALVNFGDLWIVAGRLHLAGAPLRRARWINAAPAEALLTEGVSSLLAGHFGAARRAIAAALALAPGLPTAFNNFAAAGIEPREVRRSFQRALAIEPGNAQVHSNLLFAEAYAAELDNPARFAEIRRWQSRHALLRPTRGGPHANRREPERPLKVGYLSADLRSHPIAYNLEGLFENHDGSVVETYAYSLAAAPDEVTNRLTQKVNQWRNVAGLGEAEIAERARQDGIDILVLLAAHIGDNRPLVAAYGAAPVQIAFHDVMSSGVAAIGYWLTDWVLHPQDTPEQFTERLVRLPCFYLHRPPAGAPEPMVAPAAQSRYITFGSCNNPLKINDLVVDVWGRILHQVPDSRLLLKYKNCFADAYVQDCFRRRFAERNVPSERLMFVGGDLARSEQLALLNRIDVALDPFPFNGSTTSFEALWMGVPLVTMAGDHFVARVGASLLVPLGLEEWVAHDADEYRRIAIRLAGEARGAKEPRIRLRHQVAASPLCDARAYARAIESAYRSMWREWCAQR